MALQVINEIEIEAPAAKVWEVLTTSAYTTQYMFGCTVESDWHVGNLIEWKMNYEGKDIIPVTGFIKTIQPNVKLVYTVFDPAAEMQNIPENHLNVEYSLIQKDDITVLTVTQDGFEGAANGQKRYEDVYNNGEGWNPILIQIKTLAEEN